MTESISMPGCFRGNSEFSLKEVLTYHDVLKNILENRTGFVSRYHTSRHKIETTFLYKFSESSLFLIWSPLPPHLEELNFGMIESSFRIFLQSCKHAVEYDIDMLVEVFIYCQKPSSILMTVRNHVEFNLFHFFRINCFKISESIRLHSRL